MIKKVKFVWVKGLIDLTVGNVYDVVEHIKKNYPEYNYTYETIIFYNDIGELSTSYLQVGDSIYFVDVTAEIRDNIIDGILL